MMLTVFYTLLFNLIALAGYMLEEKGKKTVEYYSKHYFQAEKKELIAQMKLII